VDLSGNFEAVLHLRKEVPLEVVVPMFQRLASLVVQQCPYADQLFPECATNSVLSRWKSHRIGL
jgi:hypothetical protein